MHEMSKPIFPRRQFAWNVKAFFLRRQNACQSLFSLGDYFLKCQGLFSENNKKYVTTLLPAAFALRAVNGH